MSILFDDNDHSYQRWLVANPHGYVINTRRRLSPSYMVLHRASCSSIRKYSSVALPGALTERSYVKVCAAGVADLRNWLRQHGRTDGAPSKECGLCARA
jgi:hypothetical protein